MPDSTESIATQWGRSGHRALVNTGATHNFISEGKAKRLGLKTERDTSRIKAVNSAAKPIHGIAKGVELQIGGWKGTTNFLERKKGRP